MATPNWQLQCDVIYPTGWEIIQGGFEPSWPAVKCSLSLSLALSHVLFLPILSFFTSFSPCLPMSLTHTHTHTHYCYLFTFSLHVVYSSCCSLITDSCSLICLCPLTHQWHVFIAYVSLERVSSVDRWLGRFWRRKDYPSRWMDSSYLDRHGTGWYGVRSMCSETFHWCGVSPTYLRESTSAWNL